MTRYLAAYAVCIIVMLLLDGVWIGVLARPWYQQGIGHLMAERFNGLAAAAFYAIYGIGLVYFVILPGGASAAWSKTVISAALFGLCAYAAYDLTNAYFVPDPQLVEELESAARRGVEVILILPSKTDSWLVFNAGRAHYERLLRAGVRIHERRGVLLHSKTALIDGVWSTVGSTNLDWRSFLHNYEVNAVILGAEFGRQVQAMFDRDLAQSDAITLAQWERRTIDLRVKEMFARAWEYWL